MQKNYNHQDYPAWFIPGWFEPVTDQDRKDIKTLCNILAKKQDQLAREVE